MIAGPKALKWPKIASKRLLARIWSKMAVSQWSQKGILLAGPKALKWQKIASKGPRKLRKIVDEDILRNWKTYE